MPVTLKLVWHGEGTSPFPTQPYSIGNIFRETKLKPKKIIAQKNEFSVSGNKLVFKKIMGALSYEANDPQFNSIGGLLRFDIPITKTKLGMTVQSWLLKFLPNGHRFRTGTFAESFPDLRAPRKIPVPRLDRLESGRFDA